MEDCSAASASASTPPSSSAADDSVSSKFSVDFDDADAPSLQDLAAHVRALEREKAEWKALLADKKKKQQQLLHSTEKKEEDEDAPEDEEDECLLADEDVRFVCDAPDYAAVARHVDALHRRVVVASERHQDFLEGVATLAACARTRADGMVDALLRDVDADAQQ